MADTSGRGALAVTLGILSSRLVGLVRQRVLAHFLGTSEAADALTAALRVGNLTQNLLGEGALSASFIPVYARLRAQDPEAAKAFARSALGALLPAVLGLSALGVLAAPWLTRLVAWGFEGPRLVQAVGLVRILFPMTGLLVLSAWALGVLAAHRRFFLPYAAPVVWSVTQIAAALGAGLALHADAPGVAEAVAWGALAGAGLQLAVMGPAVRACIGSVLPRFDRTSAPLREAVSRLPAAILGRGVIQLSGLFDTMLVSLLGAGAVATFGYAQTLYLLPMSVLGTGEAAAALPALSEAGAEGDALEARRRALGEVLTRGLGRTLTLGVGAAFALAALGPEIVTLLLRGGSFGGDSAEAVADVLAVYAVGLPANAASRLYATACFAQGDTTGPARFATVRVLVSAAGALAAMHWLGVGGVVAGAVVAAWVELALLVGSVRRSIGTSGTSASTLVRTLAAGLALAGAGLGARFGGQVLGLGAIWAALVTLCAAGGSFAVAATALRLPGLAALTARLRRQR